MSFRSLYRHGFARVAACTTRTALADPATNAATILRMAQDCDRQAVALAVFPELGISGYAISDLLQQIDDAGCGGGCDRNNPSPARRI